MNSIESISFSSTLQRLINEGKTIRQISRAFDQEVSNARVEMYNQGIPEGEIQRRLVAMNQNIDDNMAVYFSRQVPSGMVSMIQQPATFIPHHRPSGMTNPGNPPTISFGDMPPGLM